MLNHIATTQTDKKTNQEQMDKLGSKVDQLVRQNDILLNMLQRTMANQLAIDQVSSNVTQNDKDGDGGNGTGGAAENTAEPEVAVSSESSDNSMLDMSSGDINGSNSLQDLSEIGISQHLAVETNNDKQDSFKTTSNVSCVGTVDVQIEIEPDIVHTSPPAYQQYVKRLWTKIYLKLRQFIYICINNFNCVYLFAHTYRSIYSNTLI